MSTTLTGPFEGVYGVRELAAVLGVSPDDIRKAQSVPGRLPWLVRSTHKINGGWTWSEKQVAETLRRRAERRSQR